MSIPLSVSRLSLHLSISNSLSFQSSLIPSLQTQNSIGTKTPDQCGGVEIGIWGLVQRSVFGCGVEISIGLWVYCGFCLGLSWVAWVRIGVGLGVVWRSALGCGFCLGLSWVAWVRIGVGLGVVWRLALGCGFVVGFVWVFRGLCGFGSPWVIGV